MVEAPIRSGVFAFAHGLIRETIYERLSAIRRARLHLRAGQALEALKAHRLDDYAEQLAHHYGQGGDDSKSFEYQLRAARAAARVHASEAAIAHYDTGLETGMGLGLSPATDERIRRLLVERGWLRYVGGDIEGSLTDYASALEAARTSADRRLEADALDHIAFIDKLADAELSQHQHRAALAIAEELGDVQTADSRPRSALAAGSNQLDLAGPWRSATAPRLARRSARRDRAGALDAIKLAALHSASRPAGRAHRELGRSSVRNGELWYLQWTLLESTFAPLARADWDAAQDRARRDTCDQRADR